MSRCKHDWELVDKTILESPMTKLIKNNILKEASGASEGFYIDRIVFVFTCKTCGDYSIEER